MKLFKTPSEKISVIYEGVDEKFKVLDKKTIEKNLYSLDLTVPYLLYTGVWRTHKNLHHLIKAFAILKNEYQFKGKLVITGPQDRSMLPASTGLWKS